MGTSFPPLPYSLLLSLTNDPFFFYIYHYSHAVAVGYDEAKLSS